MKEFLRRFRILFVAIVLVLVALQLIGNRLEGRSDLSMLDRAVLAIYRPVNKGIMWPFRKIAGLWSDYVALVGVKEENRRLLIENARVRMQLSTLREQALANQRYRQMLGIVQNAPGEPLAAEVIARSVVGEHHTIIVDRGSRDGVELGLAVITPDGLVGFITKVAGRVSIVTLIIDPRSAVDAVDQRSRARGVIQGLSTDRCVFEFLEQSLDVALGDRVVTSGLGTRYVVPKGIMIGSVVRVEKEQNGLTQRVEIEPSVDFSGLEEVLIQLPSADAIDLWEIDEVDPAQYMLDGGPRRPGDDDDGGGPAGARTDPAPGTGGGR